jgi:2-C-methyl-D-erythritol 4-phosphate cytidylyltransferase/2-C-methyl-D-erythritol 2,4-cyclodiphosphate synthase
MTIGLIIVCAGVGKRLGKADKAVILVGEKPLFYHAVKAFENISGIKKIALVLRKANFSLANKFIIDKRVVLVEGGKERQDSVLNGIRALGESVSHVLIHDGARPFISSAVISRVIKALAKNDAVICAVPAQDALKRVAGEKVNATLRRENIVCVQTPQGFSRELLAKAYAQFKGQSAVDDALLVEQLGEKVKVVAGDFNNFKITYPQDIKRAQALFQGKYRVGLGIDIHKFDFTKNKLILGGTIIPADFGLAAVSDGDVVLHAISDGICGACGLGDIGDYFPPENKHCQGMNSKKIIDFVRDKSKDCFEIINIDLTIISEKPRLAAHKAGIVKSLRSILSGIAVNVKIKSKEGLDILGGTEAMACLANVLVREKNHND